MENSTGGETAALTNAVRRVEKTKNCYAKPIGNAKRFDDQSIKDLERAEN